MPSLDINLNAPQAATHRALAAVWGGTSGIQCGLPWGRGVGKSEFIRLLLYLMVASWERKVRTGGLVPFRGVRIILMCPTFKQAKDLYAAKLEEDLRPGGRWGFLRAKIDHVAWRISFPGGSWIQLFGATAAASSRGQRVDVVFVDECDDVDVDVVDSVISPWFSEEFSLKVRVYGGTPRRGRKGLLYRTFGRAQQLLLQQDGSPFSNYFAVHATGYDVPNVDKAYLEQQRQDLPAATFAREYLCDFDSAEALVFALFNAGFHIADPHPDTRFATHVGGIDWGWEHPSVLLVGGVFGAGLDAGVHVVDEYRGRHVSDEDLAAKAIAMQDRWGVERWYCDPSQPERINFFKKRGVRLTEAENAVEPGIQFVQSKMVVRRDDSSGREWSLFYVSPKCRGLIEEMGEYRRKRDARDPSIVLDEVIKKNDDSSDALRYMAFTHLGGVTGSGGRSTSGAGDFVQ